jgi:hypothetical protein
MNIESNCDSSRNLTLGKSQIVRHGIRLGLAASAVAGFSFPSLYLICEQANRGFRAIDDPVWAIWVAFLLLGPFVAFVAGLLPGIVAGGVMTTVLQLLSRFNISSPGLGSLIGIFIGGLFGYAWAQVVMDWAFLQSRSAPEAACVPLSGAIAGTIAGAWYGYKMTHWLNAVQATE